MEKYEGSIVGAQLSVVNCRGSIFGCSIVGGLINAVPSTATYGHIHRYLRIYPPQLSVISVATYGLKTASYASAATYNVQAYLLGKQNRRSELNILFDNSNQFIYQYSNQ